MRVSIHFSGIKTRIRRNLPFRFIWLVLAPLLMQTTLFAQIAEPAPIDSTIIDIGKIRHYKQLFTEAAIAIADRDLRAEDLPNLNYDTGKLKQYQSNLPAEYIENNLVLRFVLANPADTPARVFFIPGFFARKIEIFRTPYQNSEQVPVKLPKDSMRTSWIEGSRLLKLEPKDSSVYYVRLEMLRTSSNSFMPRLIQENFIRHWIIWKQWENLPQDVVTYITAGIMLLMIFYSLAVYLQNRNREFIYYSVYVFCTFILLLLKSLLSVSYSAFNFLFEEYLDFLIMVTGVYFYLIFVQKFLETRLHHHFLHRFLKSSMALLMILFLAYSCIYFFTDHYVILHIVENNVIKLYMLIMGMVFIVYSFFNKDTLLKYLAAGNLALVIFSLISFLLLLFRWKIVPQQGHILNRSLVYYEIGLVIELILFLSGLAYKNRRNLIEQVRERERLQREKERQDFEKQMAVMAAQQEERNRISADMHDELGSGVTAIRLMSEIVKSKMKGNALPEIEKISHFANELLGKMNTIIWTMKSSNDTLESLAAYIRVNAVEFFETTNIQCKVEVSVSENREISGEKRRNIYLSVKEALNNSAKHSQADTVYVRIYDRSDLLTVEIEDNGKGIDQDNLRRFGNGLLNMKRRMQSVQGEFRIEAVKGSLLVFEIPL